MGSQLVQQALNRLARGVRDRWQSGAFWLADATSCGNRRISNPIRRDGAAIILTATTLRQELTRLRARYRAILREEVRGTVWDPDEVDEELRYLCRALVAG